jgi:hypothetical protein
MKRFFGKSAIGALLVTVLVGTTIGCSGSGTDDNNGSNPSGGVTYTVTADGAANATTTTKLTFAFSSAVSGLTAADVTLTNGTGSATKGTLTGNDLSVTVATAGTVKVKIAKSGVDSSEKTVTIHKSSGGDPAGVAYTVTADGAADTTTTTKLTFAFSSAVSGLTAADVTLTNGTGSATKGTLTGNDLSVTVATAGTVKVKVAKDGVDATEKEVTVHKLSGGATADDPLTMIVGADSTDNWEEILAKAEGKFVALDLSDYPMAGDEFAPIAIRENDLSVSRDKLNAGAAKIVSLILPKAAKSIKKGSPFNMVNNSAFQYFTALESISGENVETVNEYALYGSETLASVNLPKATEIGSEAFEDCTALTEVNLPEATTIGGTAIVIGGNAFAGCTSLASISLPKATYIGGSAFSGCTALTEVDLPESTEIDNYAFSDCTSLASINLPKATYIGGSAFSDCTALTEASLPEETEISPSAFEGCTALTEVSLPEATTIGADAFRGCTSLTSVSLPNVTTIGNGAFTDCTSLESMSLPQEEPKLGSSVFAIAPDNPGNVIVPGTITVTVPAMPDGYWIWNIFVIEAGNAAVEAGGNVSKFGRSHKAIKLIVAQAE